MLSDQHIQQAREDATTLQRGKDVADAHRAYSKKLATSQAAQISSAERKSDLVTDKVNGAKVQSLEVAAVPAAGQYGRATARERAVEAQRAYDRAIAEWRCTTVP